MPYLKNLGVFFKTDTVRIENLEHGVKHLVLSRPEVKNAFNEQMIDDISEGLTRAAACIMAEEMRVLLISGEGNTFCAGADLGYMREQATRSEARNFQDARKLGQLFFRLANFPTPVVAAVRGAAIGGGLGLTVCADAVVADSQAVFATSEVFLGIVPGVISPYIVRKVGLAHAAPFMLTGKRLSAREAQLAGLVQEVCDPEDFSEKLTLTLCDYLQAGPNAARRTKELLRKISPLPNPTLFEYSAQAIAAARTSDEGQSGLGSFFEKVPPPWAADILTLRKSVLAKKSTLGDNRK